MEVERKYQYGVGVGPLDTQIKAHVLGKRTKRHGTKKKTKGILGISCSH